MYPPYFHDDGDDVAYVPVSCSRSWSSRPVEVVHVDSVVGYVVVGSPDTEAEGVGVAVAKSQYRMNQEFGLLVME